ncbi:TetR family transcriptional regulator [Yinghuangia aomiensis]
MTTKPSAARSGSAAEKAAGREKLIQACERLVAANGVDAVSVRAVNAAAGLNVAAAHYHFGSKEALVRAALAHRMSVINARRAELLGALDTHEAPDPRAVVEAFIRPLDDIRRTTPWGPTYLRFLAALSRAGHPWREALADEAALHRAAFDTALARALPHLPADILRLRFGWAAATITTALGDLDDDHDPARTLAALTDYAAGAVQSPTPGTDAGRD